VYNAPRALHTPRARKTQRSEATLLLVADAVPAANNAEKTPECSSNVERMAAAVEADKVLVF
jgi:hypothetical protein